MSVEGPSHPGPTFIEHSWWKDKSRRKKAPNAGINKDF
jgi:hypothetical protein